MLVDVPSGRVEIREDGNETSAPPLLLIHAFAASLRAWDPMIEELSRGHRVLRVDLLGHGDSEKPVSGYTMPEQAAAICAALDHFGVDRVLAVGHSGGGDVVVAMIEHHRERLAAAVLLGTPPNLSFVNLPITARLLSAPLLGGVLWKLLTDKMIRDGMSNTFAPKFRAPAGLLDAYVADFRKMTHHSYVHARRQVERYREQQDLTSRSADAGVPLMVVFGDEDQWVDPRAADGWADTTDARIEILAGVGHTPMAEAPAATAGLILGFAEACEMAGESVHRARLTDRSPRSVSPPG